MSCVMPRPDGWAGRGGGMDGAMAHPPPTDTVARARAAVAVALVATALVVTAASPADAAPQRRDAVLLAQGVGMRSHPSVRVRAVQRALVRRGYSVGAPGIDGR